MALTTEPTAPPAKKVKMELQDDTHETQCLESVLSLTKHELARISKARTPTIDLTRVLPSLPNVRLLIINNMTLVEVLSVTDVVAIEAMKFTENLLTCHPSMISAVQQCLEQGSDGRTLFGFIPESDQSNRALLCFGLAVTMTNHPLDDIARKWATNLDINVAQFVFRPIRETLRQQFRLLFDVPDIKTIDLDVHSMIKPHLDFMRRQRDTRMRGPVENYFVVQNEVQGNQSSKQLVQKLFSFAKEFKAEVRIRKLMMKQVEQEIAVISKSSGLHSIDLKNAQEHLRMMNNDLITVYRLSEAVSERLRTLRLTLPTL